MKKITLCIAAMLISLSGVAQMYLWEGGHYVAANIDSITFSDVKVDSTFTIEESFLEVQEGTTDSLTLVNHLYDKELYKWSSSNIGVVSIDQNGVYTTHKQGFAILSAFYAGRGQTCLMLVVEGDGDSPSGGDDSPSGDDTKLTGVEVTPSELTMVPGEEYRLSYTLIPSEVIAGVEWSSSDPNVAVVNERGVVTAVGYGTANILATCGDITGSCAVKVLSYYENLSFTNAIVWDVDTTAFGGEVHEITTLDGSETFNCYLAMAELWLCADGFYINESGYLDGGDDATYITVYAPIWYGTNHLNPEKGGVQFIFGDWSIAETDTLVAKNGTPGTLNEEAYMTYMDYALQSYNAGDGQMFSTYLSLIGGYVNYPAGWPVAIQGATMTTLEYSVDESGEGGYSYSYIPDGIVTEGQFKLNANGASVYMCGVEYHVLDFLPILNNNTYTWGCNWLFNEDGTISWGDDKVMHWGEKVTMQYGELPAAAPAKMKPLHVPVMKIDYPEIAERVELQLKELSVKAMNRKK